MCAPFFSQRLVSTCTPGTGTGTVEVGLQRQIRFNDKGIPGISLYGMQHGHGLGTILKKSQTNGIMRRIENYPKILTKVFRNETLHAFLALPGVFCLDKTPQLNGHARIFKGQCRKNSYRSQKDRKQNKRKPGVPSHHFRFSTTDSDQTAYKIDHCVLGGCIMCDNEWETLSRDS